MDMFDLLAHRARVTPERPALEDLESGERYNYAQFNERAARLAAAAREHWGLEEGDRLAYLGHSRAEFFAMLFGCAKAGLILVPLNWRLAVPDLAVPVDDRDPGAPLFGPACAAPAPTRPQRPPRAPTAPRPTPPPHTALTVWVAHRSAAHCLRCDAASSGPVAERQEAGQEHDASHSPRQCRGGENASRAAQGAMAFGRSLP